MENTAREKFDVWHSNRPVDSNIDTPWHSFVVEHLSRMDLREKKILEIGCGRGGFACWLSKQYSGSYGEFTAADFSASAVAKGKLFAEQIQANRIIWKEIDIMQMDLPNAYFDIVISCETIEHVPNPRLAIRELYRVLKPGGTLLLTTPNYFNFYGLYRVYLRLTGRKWTELGQPINKFVMIPRTLKWLQNTGFKISYFNSIRISYPSLLAKKEVKLDWSRPKKLMKFLGINSFFLAHK